ncbi:hypothetical protein CN283_08145 [Bacillus thuringiensis]|uniref:hypothetical protein n=1 Tax=Bacillus thuringiensis TaxID=1428 RepID=UPI000BF8572B|nr:hypothetical protein [Bacillus thuringiensis]PFB90091.1 hypothetical protein CN283_08145 [Bacillus thuringiensis]
MKEVKEISKPRSFRFTDSQLAFIDELVDIENQKRMRVAEEMNLVYRPLNRTSFLMYLAEEKNRKNNMQGQLSI